MLRELFCWHSYQFMTWYKSFFDIDRWPDLYSYCAVYRCTKCKKVKEERVNRGIREFVEKEKESANAGDN